MTINFWRDKKVVVTGGNGFLGRHLVAKIKAKKPKSIFVPQKAKYDLRVYNNCVRAVRKGNIIIHLAGNVGGIGFNREFPADLYDDNILMGTYMMMAARKMNVQKYIALGTVCAYPKFTKVPFREENLWKGYPEETNAPYGLAKKMQLVQAEAYRKQYGFNAIFLLPVNLYGPGDNFDLKSSHVIPALIRKFIDAKEKRKSEVVVWGTGKASREFLYVDDAAEAILLAAEKYDKSEPVNLGTGREVKIRELVRLIKKYSGYKGRVIWDTARPDGQPRRMMNIDKARKEFGFKAKTSLETGLKKTIEWYIRDKNKI
jgi:GDP-L-fucose synthase